MFDLDLWREIFQSINKNRTRTILSGFTVVFAIMLFTWKKWPLYAFCGSAVVAFILNLSIGIGILTSISGLIGPLITFSFMKRRWDMFD